MHSPFPGMDPWLEGPDIFPDLRQTFTVRLSSMLNRLLPERFYASLGQREWYVGDDDPFSESFIEVYACPGKKDLHSVIEVLSIQNKTAADPGRALYLKRQKRNLAKAISVIEVDLLRAGKRTTFASRTWDEVLESMDYHVSIRRYDEGQGFEVHPWQLQSRLPRIAFPAVINQAPLLVDLQKSILDECYDNGVYERRVRYRKQLPEPPLTQSQMSWAKKVLKAHHI